MIKRNAKARQRLILAGMFAIFFAVLTWTTYTFVTVKLPGANDFYQCWNPAHLYFTRGLDPYSPAVARQTELDLYGHPYDPNPALDELPGNFWYPFSVILLIAPISWLSYALASAIWLTLIGVGTCVVFWMLADLFHWRLSPTMLVVGIIWALTFYPATRGIYLGQVGMISIYLQIVVLWALAKKQDTLAGFALAISTVKPQLGLLFIPFLILWAIREKRWRFVLVSAGVFAALTIASFVLLPSWVGEWWQQVAVYTGYTRIEAPLELITRVYLPFLGTVVQIILSGVLLLLLAWPWYQVLWRRRTEWFDWTIGLTIIVTNLVLPRTATPHYAELMYVFVFYFHQLAMRKGGNRQVIALMFIINVAQWALFLATIQGNIEALINLLPLPIGLLILLMATRQLWLRARPSLPAVAPLSPPTAVISHAV